MTGACSLGTWMVLALIDEARRRGRPHVYLGYWIDGAPKMSYKAHFRPRQGPRPVRSSLTRTR